MRVTCRSGADGSGAFAEYRFHAGVIRHRWLMILQIFAAYYGPSFRRGIL